MEVGINLKFKNIRQQEKIKAMGKERHWQFKRNILTTTKDSNNIYYVFCTCCAIRVMS
jgi:hypothetical protein